MRVANASKGRERQREKEKRRRKSGEEIHRTRIKKKTHKIYTIQYQDSCLMQSKMSDFVIFISLFIFFFIFIIIADIQFQTVYKMYIRLSEYQNEVTQFTSIWEREKKPIFFSLVIMNIQWKYNAANTVVDDSNVDTADNDKKRQQRWQQTCRVWVLGYQFISFN